MRRQIDGLNLHPTVNAYHYGVEVIQLLQSLDYDAELQKAADALTAGKIVVMPTDTVYGAAAMLQDTDALARLSQVRKATADSPWTVHLAKRDQARKFTGEVSAMGERVMRKLWPGPVGLVFDVLEGHQQKVAAELGVNPQTLYRDGQITLRCPASSVLAEVLSLVEPPVVATTLDVSDQTDAALLAAELEGKADLLLDGGPAVLARPSTLIKVAGDDYVIVREGLWDRRTIERLLRTTVLYVCSGNTCRSPMAEALTRKMFAEKLGVSEHQLEANGYIVASAGAMTAGGSPASPPAVEAVAKMGADLSRHRSRALTHDIINEADVILVMGNSHMQAVLATSPGSSDKVATLDKDGDIEDPFGADVEAYRTLAERMETLIRQRLGEWQLL